MQSAVLSTWPAAAPRFSATKSSGQGDLDRSLHEGHAAPWCPAPVATAPARPGLSRQGRPVRTARQVSPRTSSRPADGPTGLNGPSPAFPPPRAPADPVRASRATSAPVGLQTPGTQETSTQQTKASSLRTPHGCTGQRSSAVRRCKRTEGPERPLPPRFQNFRPSPSCTFRKLEPRTLVAHGRPAEVPLAPGGTKCQPTRSTVSQGGRPSFAFEDAPRDLPLRTGNLDPCPHPPHPETRPPQPSQ